MTRQLAFALAAASLTVACQDPTAGKAKASVEAVPAPAAAPAPAPADGVARTAIAITPTNAKIEWIGSKVTASHPGSFTRFSGTLAAAPTVEQSRVSLEIDMDSVQSDSERLTGHLKSDDFFDVAKHPKATFVSTAIQALADRPGEYEVRGNLTLRGTTKALAFPARIALGAQKAQVSSEFSINRKDFGILYPGKIDDLIRDDVLIKLDVDAPRETAAAQ